MVQLRQLRVCARESAQAPIYEGLAAALAADLAVTQATLAAVLAPPSSGSGGQASATYALVTHPGHHASKDSCAGYCVRTQVPAPLSLTHTLDPLRSLRSAPYTPPKKSNI